MSSTLNITDTKHKLSQILAEASENDVISLEPGEYYLDKPLEIDKNINLMGTTGDPADVVLIGRCGAAIHLSAPNARISGVTVCNEQVASDSNFDYIGTSAVYIDGGEPEIVNCIITSHGDGIIIAEENTAPIIRYCKINNCSGGGVWIINKGKAVLYRCTLSYCSHAILAVGERSAVKVIKSEFHHGENIGAYVYENSFGRFKNCIFHSNALTGFEIKNNSDCVCEECLMHHNQEHGVCVWSNSYGRFEHCDIHDNGNAQVMSIGSSPHFIACTIHDGDFIGIWAHKSSNGQYDSCEVYRTMGAAITVSDSSDPTFNECVIHHSKSNGIMCVLNSLGRFSNCEVFMCLLPGVFIADKAIPSFIDCSVHHNREGGVMVNQKGEGKFFNNIFFDNHGNNWMIESDAGPIVREDNSPNW